MARRKITKAAEIDASALPDLTPKQFAFVKGILEGKSYSDAYRAAYDCENMLPESIWCEASKLHSDPKVAQWLLAARQAGAQKAECTLDGHLSELERLKRAAEASGNFGAAVQAEQLKGKASGHYTEQYRDMGSNVTDSALLDAIEMMLGKQAKEEAARKLGIATEPQERVH